MPDWLLPYGALLIGAVLYFREVALRREAEAARDANIETVDGLSGRVSTLTGSLSEADAGRIAAEDRYSALLSEQEQAKHAALSPSDRAKLTSASRCVHCGGVHSVACPRVKRIRFRQDGQTPLEVEFWADAEWSRAYVIFPEDFVEDEAVSAGAQDAQPTGGA